MRKAGNLLSYFLLKFIKIPRNIKKYESSQLLTTFFALRPYKLVVPRLFSGSFVDSFTEKGVSLQTVSKKERRWH
jgi:hypothetical protein